MGFGNQFRTVILLGVLTGILLWVGNLVGGMQGLTFALIFSWIFIHVKHLTRERKRETVNYIREFWRSAKENAIFIDRHPGEFKIETLENILI